ncbi:hypothetical protein ASPWEDRAFT_646939 [Aspergillus wentii DTO 134E9]|uniref:Uncharacterized protein n=1 Tax=Aspergillus wentii DTO 134E9 TaxID=1073089 RepID=A0A1L9RAT5_ASPWE|nr:uncharacterized protein ASPWEDRAFT_646939 [Aspergillus wentii DTO 134E9]OJJ32046.1 hypothetical protein ASPWEDRAFT_646939 [Aspergillus wentii DTO 134E9]
MPCRRRRRRPFLTMAKIEKQQLQEILFHRAQRFDFRRHLAEYSTLDLDTIEKMCFETIEEDEENLELVALKVANRPDASIFPFLEGIRPKEHPTWHISRARCLPRYTYAWAIKAGNTDMFDMKLISLDGESFVDMEIPDMHGETYVVILFPRTCVKNDMRERLPAVCNHLMSSDEIGIVISQSEFQKM